MKIHIMGASCSGSTTLGLQLSHLLGYPYFDSDTYFWEPSEIPFTVRRDPALRDAMIARELVRHDNWIFGGSVINWGADWLNIFDLIVFLYIPKQIRMQRLAKREFERYGDIIFNDPHRAMLYQNFLNWAAGYDDNTTQGRNLHAHESWLKKAACPVVNISGDTTLKYRTDVVLQTIAELQKPTSAPFNFAGEATR